MEGRGVLDTSAVIRLGGTDPASLPDEAAVTAVTPAGSTVGPLLARTEAERAVRLAHLQQAEADFDVLPFDGPAARALGRVAADLRAIGRKPAPRAHDVLIAATALAASSPLCTADPDDFAGAAGLEVREVRADPGPGARR